MECPSQFTAGKGVGGRRLWEERTVSRDVKSTAAVIHLYLLWKKKWEGTWKPVSKVPKVLVVSDLNVRGGYGLLGAGGPGLVGTPVPRPP